MNKSITNSIRFVFFVLLQLYLLDNFLFLDYINPYVYIIFILLLPISMSSIQVMLLSFLLGLTLDVFHNSGGVHAAACLVLGYFRPLALRNAFGVNFDFQTLKFYGEGFKPLLVYVSIMVGIHHLVMFSMEAFSLAYIPRILTNTLYSGIFSIALIILVIYFLKPSKK
ncbi:MAG: rod shape-determining protein MreD [Psychroflexus maritimus]